jgi:spore coat-associated protein N
MRRKLRMSIKKKLLMATGTMALAAMLVSAGTFALFTSEATNAGNTFTSGTVSIEDVTGGAAFNQTMFFDNLAPGDGESATVTIENNGSLDAWVRIDTSNSVGTGALFEGTHPLAITLDGDVVQIPADGSATFDVSYSFPLAADNSYQEATGSLDINFQAVQVRNNVNTAGDGPISWNEDATP